jgi:hypothetical protein
LPDFSTTGGAPSILKNRPRGRLRINPAANGLYPSGKSVADLAVIRPVGRF